MGRYGPEAYAPDGTLWWRLTIAPGKKRLKFGDEQKISAYLACHVGQDGTLTMRMLREALGEETVPNDKEHLNRRLRNLRRRDGWTIASQRDDGSLSHDQYRIVKIGWHPGTGTPRPADDQPKDSTRRKVYERDAGKCVICGIGSREEYEDQPGRTARLTLGHRIPGMRLSKEATVDELQTECARCNEPVRDEMHDPPSLFEVLPSLRGLSGKEKRELLRRLLNNRHTRTKLDELHDQARRLSASEREQLMDELRKMVRDH